MTYRVAFIGGHGGGKVFREVDPRVLTLAQAKQLHRAYRRRAFTTWVEDEDGRHVPVPGAMSKAYATMGRNETSGRNRTAGSSHAADLNRRLHAVALAHPRSPVAVIERGECRGEAGPIVAERAGNPGRLTVAVAIGRDGRPGDGHACEVTTNDVISRRPAPEREVDRLRRIRAERSHELTPGMNYANATAGRGRGGVPKSFRKLATSPTREGIEKHIAAYYGGEHKQLIPSQSMPGWFQVVSGDRILSTVVIETPRGFYFGVPVPGANGTNGATRGRPVGYRCRACGRVTARLPRSGRCKCGAR